MSKSMKQLIDHTLKRDLKKQIKDEQKKRERQRELQKIKDSAYNDQFKEFLEKLSQEKKVGKIKGRSKIEHKKGKRKVFGFIYFINTTLLVESRVRGFRPGLRFWANR